LSTTRPEVDDFQSIRLPMKKEHYPKVDKPRRASLRDESTSAAIRGTKVLETLAFPDVFLVTALLPGISSSIQKFEGFDSTFSPTELQFTGHIVIPLGK
ncbi:MAG: hypothetical protein ACK559_25120, partial [bacterium]